LERAHQQFDRAFEDAREGLPFSARAARHGWAAAALARLPPQQGRGPLPRADSAPWVAPLTHIQAIAHRRPRCLSAWAGRRRLLSWGDQDPAGVIATMPGRRKRRTAPQRDGRTRPRPLASDLSRHRWANARRRLLRGSGPPMTGRYPKGLNDNV